MVSPVKVFLDSSIIVEYRNGTKTELLDALTESKSLLFYNQIVLSEYLFVVLTYYGQKSLRSLQESKKIQEILVQQDVETLLKTVNFLGEANESIISESIRLMKAYNFLPNDAIILAHCKTNGINYLASYDSDFKIPCQQENIVLIDSVEKLRELALNQ